MKETIPVPEGTRSIVIEFRDEISVAFEQAEAQGSASVPLHKPKPHCACTGLDILRQRGTPIELIHSTLVADDLTTATHVFRTVVLEYVYEKIANLYPDSDVRFINSSQLHRQGDSNTPEDQVGLMVSGPGRGIAFTPTFDATPFEDHGFIPVCAISGGRVHRDISDHGHTATMSLLETLTDNIVENVKNGVSNANIEKGTRISFYICVDLSVFSLKSSYTGIDAEASIALLAYTPYTN